MRGFDLGNNGEALHKQEDGCGALTFWEYGTDSNGGYAEFDLPLFIKDGCVERALASAGGPRLSCVLNRGGQKRDVGPVDRNSDRRRAQKALETPSASAVAAAGPSLFLSGTPTYSYPTTANATISPYVPMTWVSGTGPATYSWTYYSYTTGVITTTTPIAANSTVPLPYNSHVKSERIF